MIVSDERAKENQEQAKATHKRAIETANLLKAELAALGHTINDDVKTSTCCNRIDDVYIYLRVNEDHSGSSYYSKPTTKLRVTFTQPDQRTKQYPEPKAGFDLKKIAAVISESVKALKAKSEREKQRVDAKQSNAVIAEKLNQEFGLVWEFRAVADNSGRLALVLQKPLTEDQAREIIKATLAVIGK